jgi:transcription elongation factor GreA
MNTPTIRLTHGGFQKLTQELEELRTVRRPQVQAWIRHSREAGDAIDNAAYDEAQGEQAYIDGRIRDLEMTLKSALLVPVCPSLDVVMLGSQVTVADDSGLEERYTIVGSIEADPRHGLISDESPVGRALIGRRPGETVSVAAPGGTFDLVVVAIG